MSTIITTNPYTFTVEDNMSIKAVFEDSNATVITIGSEGKSYTSYGNVNWTMNYNGSRIAHGYWRAAYSPEMTIDRQPPFTVEIGKYFSLTTQGSYQGGTMKIKIYSGSTLLTSGTYIQIPASWGGKSLKVNFAFE